MCIGSEVNPSEKDFMEMRTEMREFMSEHSI